MLNDSFYGAFFAQNGLRYRKKDQAQEKRQRTWGRPDFLPERKFFRLRGAYFIQTRGWTVLIDGIRTSSEFKLQISPIDLLADSDFKKILIYYRYQKKAQSARPQREEITRPS